MADQHCLCPMRPVGTVRDDAVERALRELDDAGGLDAAERDAVAALADRLTARLAVLAIAPCPRHGASARTGAGDGTAGTADRDAPGD